MPEWLTTGQMVDRLQVGEVAVCNVGTTVIRNKSGDIGSKDSPTNTICINSVVAKRKWRILPKYVSFEEAMKALKENKMVSFYDGDWNCKVDSAKYWSETPLQDYRLLDLYEGKWTIEGDLND